MPRGYCGAPRCVRNFWIDASIDGRAERVGTGPRTPDGGFTMDIQIRDKGNVATAARLTGRNCGGKLILEFSPAMTPARVENDGTVRIEADR